MAKIRFGTDGWRAIIADDFTTANVARVAEATALWQLEQSDSPSVVVGHDCRFGGKLFTDVTARVLCARGVKVYLTRGFVSTPMISLGARELGCGAGVIITASHNPPAYNGFKLKSGFGGPSVPADVQRVESLIPEHTEIPTRTVADFETSGMLQFVDLEDMYLKQVQSHFDLDLIREAGIGIAYDAMYGAGQRIFQRILPEATLLHCEENPSFRGQAPEPLEKNLRELARTVRDNPDLTCGIATDGDADRLGMFDENGRFVDSHHVMLLLIHYLRHYKKMDGKVIAAFSLTEKVKKLCRHYGLDYEITKIGFKYITERMIREDVLVGGEESGGIALKGHLPERDGIWDALTLLEFMAITGKKLSELVQEVYDIVGPFKYTRDDLHLDEAAKQAVIARCAEGGYQWFGPYEILRVETIDGFKFHLPHESWVMVRPSGTEPVLRMYAEGPDMDTARDILAETQKALLG